MTWTAFAITSAGRFWRFGPLSKCLPPSIHTERILQSEVEPCCSGLSFIGQFADPQKGSTQDDRDAKSSLHIRNCRERSVNCVAELANVDLRSVHINFDTRNAFERAPVHDGQTERGSKCAINATLKRAGIDQRCQVGSICFRLARLIVCPGGV
jgi:hypothetical protein